MKTRKQWAFAAIAVLFGMVVALAACDNGGDDPKCTCVDKIHDGECGASCVGKGILPCDCEDIKYGQIENLFDADGYGANVVGILTVTQWTGVLDKVNTAIIRSRDSIVSLPNMIPFINPFKNNITIIVEDTTAYSAKFDKNKPDTFYIAYNALDTVILVVTVAAMVDGTVDYVEAYSTDPVSTLQRPTTLPLDFGGQAIIYNSSDTFTPAEWIAFTARVVAAIQRGYDKDMGEEFLNTLNKEYFATVFAENQYAYITISSSATNNIEVKDDEYRNLYLKTSVIDTVDIQPAVEAMNSSKTYVGN